MVTIAKIINSFVAKRILLLDINENLINDMSSFIFNKIEVNENIKKSIYKNNRSRIISKTEFVHKDNSSVGMNNKNERAFESNLKTNLNKQINCNNIYKENIGTISFFSKPLESKKKTLTKIRINNKQSNFCFYVCPFFFLKKMTKFEYFAKLEQNFSEYFSIENFFKVLEANKIIIEERKDYN